MAGLLVLTDRSLDTAWTWNPLARLPGEPFVRVGAGRGKGKQVSLAMLRARLQTMRARRREAGAELRLTPTTVPFLLRMVTWLWDEGVRTVRAALAPTRWDRATLHELRAELKAVARALLWRRLRGEPVAFATFDEAPTTSSFGRVCRGLGAAVEAGQRAAAQHAHTYEWEPRRRPRWLAVLLFLLPALAAAIAGGIYQMHRARQLERQIETYLQASPRREPVPAPIVTLAPPAAVPAPVISCMGPLTMSGTTLVACTFIVPGAEPRTVRLLTPADGARSSGHARERRPETPREAPAR